MNLKKLAKSIFSIYCLLFIASVNCSLNWNTNVLAQDSVIQKESTSNLSALEQADLEQGKVILQGKKGNYLGQVVATADVETAWLVLVDYDNFANFIPNIASSKIINQKSDRVVFEQVNVVDLWLFKQEFKVQIEAIKNKPTTVNFRIVDGDLKKLVGKWEIAEIEPNKVLISHRVEVEPGSDTEKPFFYGVYESSLEETLQAISQEMSRRYSNREQ